SKPAAKPAASKTAAKPAAAKPAARRAPATRKRAASGTALDQLTIVALRDRARAEGRTGYSRLSKAQLISLLSS
ncbi:MAG: hypothetical protein ACTIKQ_11820, partial [Microbacterium sp.]